MLLRSFLSALSFLTLIPIGGGSGFTQPEISISRGFYPLVGLLVGALVVAVELICRQVFPPAITAALLVLLMVVVTRGLHLDGFMDICDGLLGAYNKERRLAIMRDSHVGAFAVAGAFSLLILKYGALASLVSIDGAGKTGALLLFPLLSRWSMVILLQTFPYVRESGLGTPFHQEGANPWGATAFALLTALIAGSVIGGIGGIVLLVGASLLSLVFGWKIHRMLGGLTGDVYGACNETVETVVLVAAVAILPHGLLNPGFGLI